jgi:hypothetical protein
MPRRVIEPQYGSSLLALALLLAAAGCTDGAGYYSMGTDSSSDGSGGAADVSSGSSTGSSDLYAVEHDGKTYLLNEGTSGEADIVGSKGVTVITTDSDGTATFVDPAGHVSIYESDGMGGSFKVNTDP